MNKYKKIAKQKRWIYKNWQEIKTETIRLATKLGLKLKVLRASIWKELS